MLRSSLIATAVGIMVLGTMSKAEEPLYHWDPLIAISKEAESLVTTFDETKERLQAADVTAAERAALIQTLEDTALRMKSLNQLLEETLQDSDDAMRELVLSCPVSIPCEDLPRGLNIYSFLKSTTYIDKVELETRILEHEFLVHARAATLSQP
ncbi:MAG: hypothetical protein MUF19_01295 [Candidatus Pacebacteria bacterium]|jgi:hypothetical protein|nr:hypothetical protein [Candidatus Paceibacterota bacterium]